MLILEHLEHDTTPLTTFVRIYERAGLEGVHDLSGAGLKQSSLAFILLEGHYEDRQGNQVADLGASVEILEHITGVEVVIGDQVSKKLRNFTKLIA